MIIFPDSPILHQEYSYYHKNKNFSEIKSHHYIISFDPKDREECGLTGERAQQSEAYAQKVKLFNLKQMAQTVAYIQEHRYDSLEDFHTALDQASDQTNAARKSLKNTEQQLKDVNEQIHFTGQYLT